MSRTIVALAALLAACGPTSAEAPRPTPVPRPTVSYARHEGYAGEIRVRFATVDASRGLFAHPWPSELDRKNDGSVDLTAFPGRDHFAVSGFFEESEKHVLGFSVAPVIFVPFEQAPDAATVARAIETGAIRLIDVDPKSTTRGQAEPLRHRLFDGASHVPDGTLAVRPKGVLRADHLYALVVERRWSDDAEPLGTTGDFEQLKSTTPHADPVRERARKIHADALDWLHESGLPRSEVGGLAVFRTQAAEAPVEGIVRAAERLAPRHQPLMLRARWLESLDRASYRVIGGYYCTPTFQSGLEDAPFIQAGGLIESDAKGRPLVFDIPASSEFHVAECGGRMRARFALTLPRGEMPAGGWPLMVYAHGTTGDAHSLLDGAFAEAAASAGMAAVSTDQPLHGSGDPQGARPGSNSSFAIKLGPVPIPIPGTGKGGELAFYNALRPVVLRDNMRQAVVDAALLARLVLATDFATAHAVDGTPLLPAHADVTSPRFDQKLGYVATGHSQGSQSMAALGSIDPLARATLLSACGGDFSSVMLSREDTQKPKRIVEIVLGLAKGELDEFHPFATAMQTMLDPVDPQTFGARYQALDHARSVLMVSGVGDSMSIDRAGAQLTRALRLQPLAPLPLAIDGLAELGIVPSATVGKNGPGARTTLALLQLTPSYEYEPHFVAFREPVAREVMQAFLGAIASGETAPSLSR